MAVLASEVLAAFHQGDDLADLGAVSVETATRWLRAHQVQYVYAGGWVEVLDVEKAGDGTYLPVWVPCPRTYRELLAWLGY